MSFKLLFSVLLAMVVVGGMLAVAPVHALDRSMLRERLEERREAFDLRREALPSAIPEAAPSPSPSPQETPSGDTEEEVAATCRCSARLRFARPELRWHQGVLTFFPRVDIRVSSRGDLTAPAWTAQLAYSGASTYASDTVAVPTGTTFAGQQTVFSGQCGSEFDFDGYQLPPVPLTGVIASLVGDDQEMAGWVTMRGQLTGCDMAEEQERFSFELDSPGELRTRSWRTVR